MWPGPHPRSATTPGERRTTSSRRRTASGTNTRCTTASRRAASLLSPNAYDTATRRGYEPAGLACCPRRIRRSQRAPRIVHADGAVSAHRRGDRSKPVHPVDACRMLRRNAVRLASPHATPPERHRDDGHARRVGRARPGMGWRRLELLRQAAHGRGDRRRALRRGAGGRLRRPHRCDQRRPQGARRHPRRRHQERKHDVQRRALRRRAPPPSPPSRTRSSTRRATTSGPTATASTTAATTRSNVSTPCAACSSPSRATPLGPPSQAASTAQPGWSRTCAGPSHGSRSPPCT